MSQMQRPAAAQVRGDMQGPPCGQAGADMRMPLHDASRAKIIDWLVIALLTGTAVAVIVVIWAVG